MARIEINTQVIHKSFAQFLNAIPLEITSPFDSGTTRGYSGECVKRTPEIYDNPNQQKTRLPAWFIVHRDATTIEEEVGRFFLVFSIDLVFMHEYNEARLFDTYSTVADYLDLHLKTLSIVDVEGVSTGARVHVYERQARVDMDCLRYSTTLRMRVAKPSEDVATMDEYTIKTFIKPREIIEDPVVLSFTNTTRPEFEIKLPDAITTSKNKAVTLPTLSGIYLDGDEKYQPSAWTLGAFGSSVKIPEDTTTDLLWEKSPDVPVFEYPQGQFTSGEMQIESLTVEHLNAVKIEDLNADVVLSLNGLDVYTFFYEFNNDASGEFVFGLNDLLEFTK